MHLTLCICAIINTKFDLWYCFESIYKPIFLSLRLLIWLMIITKQLCNLFNKLLSNLQSIGSSFETNCTSLPKHVDYEWARAGKKAMGPGVSSDFSIDFPSRKLAGSFGKDNHMWQPGGTKWVTTLLNFNPTGVIDPKFWTYPIN